MADDEALTKPLENKGIYQLLNQKIPTLKLFTIEENIYCRKNPSITSPRSFNNRHPAHNAFIKNRERQCSGILQRRVTFIDQLKKKENMIYRKNSLTNLIIKNSNQSLPKLQKVLSSRVIPSLQNVQISFENQRSRDQYRPDNNKQKYIGLLSRYQNIKQLRSHQLNKSKDEKYTDAAFPPLYSSLFLITTTADYLLGGEIKWKRLSQYLEGGKPILYDANHIKKITIFADKRSYANQFMAVTLNAVKHCSCIINLIFQQQSFSVYGLYLLKIFQQSSWKNVILDEFIPIKYILEGQESICIPAFISVQCHFATSFQVWPFLIEKAYANYYSAYEKLRFGNVIDFMNEITGLAPYQLNFIKRSKNKLQSMRQKLLIKDSVGIAETSQGYFIIRVAHESNNKQLMFCHQSNFIQYLANAKLQQKIKSVFIYSPKVYHTLSSAVIEKYHHTHVGEGIQYCLRKLIVSKRTDSIISFQQKDRRLFWKSSLTYSYMWVRIILVQMSSDGWRWIEGNYSNQKSINLQQTLSQGEYYLIIMPEWKHNYIFQLTLLVWGNHTIEIQKYQHKNGQEIIQQASRDLAQRKGKRNQLSSLLCSYNYVCPRTGLIIQNINNFKPKEEVTIHRNIAGIPSCVQLLPINKIFWQKNGDVNNQMDIVIGKLSSYTIVVKMWDGKDLKLIQLFAHEEDI